MMRKKKLCIDLRWIDASGVGTYIRGIMPGLIKQLFDIQIVGLGDVCRLSEFLWSQSPNVQLIDCRQGRYSLAEQMFLPLKIPFNTHLFFSPYYTIPLLYRGRIAVTVHDMSHLVVHEIVSNLKKRLYARAMFRAIRKRASVIFTVSNFSKLELLRLTSGPRNDNIIPTHLGVDKEWFHAASLPSSHSRPYLVCVGNVKPYKNLRRLVEAFLRVRDRLPHDLVIIGQSEGLVTGESSDFFELVRSGGQRIELTGYLPRTELLALVGNADALIMPSLYEGFGLPPLEAMAAGVPTVVANAASLPEVCGDATLYIDPLNVKDIAEKLISIAFDIQLKARLRASGLERSKLYSWDTCSAATAKGLRPHLYSQNA